ncbi:aflatoxin biosynthesis ketoreductase nor-1 [Aspergillus udagawae]|uniref:Aflatoxin biosynthesis ketoreductase nor-1 n=1 Tax=Aspergillus udagawae TaxID=91492 RepID=A0A8H3RI38_9EURO|nr:aflatoxin biosynthesis ketoreductase nor-1 [Aspergillus udagawae]
MAPTVAFVTGANRGLGLGLVKGFVAKPDYIVVAAVRDPGHATAQELAKLSTGKGSCVIVVKYDASFEQSAFDAVEQATDHGVDHLDYVVANAGIAKGYPFVKDVKRADILEHIEVNVLSVVSLYQATRDLLRKSTMKPVFAIMGSGGGALGRQPPVPSASYGASKSIFPWYGVRINAEDEWLNTFVLDPGWVQTEMGNSAAKGWGIESAPDTIEKSTGGMMRVITEGTKEQYGGKVVLYTGEVQEW